MSSIDTRFLCVAIVYGIAGMIVGVWLGITENLELRPLHAHLGLLGWVSLAIFGLAYRVYPAAAATRYASLHFWIASIGTLIFAIGVYTVTTGGHHIVVTIGSILMILSMLVFLVNLIRAIDAGDSPS